MALVKPQAPATPVNQAVVGMTIPADSPAQSQPTTTQADALPWETGSNPITIDQTNQDPYEVLTPQGEAKEFPAQQALAQAPSSPAQQALAPAQAPNLPAVSTLKALEASGFEGLTIDWTSFTTISLKTEGHLEGNDGVVYGQSLVCRFHGTKTRWVYRAAPVTDQKRDIAYSYDKVTSQSGVSIETWVKEAEARGKTIEIKEYLEAMVELHDPEGPNDGEYRILSIPPTSKGRLAGVLNIAAARAGQAGLPSVLIKTSVGKKVTSTANPFYPWAFEIVK